MTVLRQRWASLSGWHWLHCGLAGVLLHAGGLMPPHVGMLLVPSAQIALVQSLAPLLTAVLGVVLLRETLRPLQWSGLFLGVAGVGLVVGQAALQSATQFQGLALAFVGVVSLVTGTVYFGRFCRGVPLLPGVTAQFLAASIAAILATAAFEAPRADWTAAAVSATVWNTFMVSLGGMGLYCGMLVRGTAARASANFYLVPGTAGLLAWALLGERLGPLALAGLVVASAGCWLVNAAAPARPVAER